MLRVELTPSMKFLNVLQIALDDVVQDIEVKREVANDALNRNRLGLKLDMIRDLGAVLDRIPRRG